jgi:MFS transporter, FHS family, glucose/mannose:H+ symporter
MTALPMNPRQAQRLRRPFAKRQTLAVAFGYFLVAGVATVMLGPTLPLLADRWLLPDAQLGTLFFAYFFGQLCGAWFATRRLGVSLLAGAVGSALGFGALAFAGPTGAHLLLFLIGLGLGAGLTAGNVVVGTIEDLEHFPHYRELSNGGHVDLFLRKRPAERVPSVDICTGNALAGEAAGDESAQVPVGTKANSASSRSTLLALLNLSWGLGAITCPLWLRVSVRLSHFIGNSAVAGSAAKSSAVFFLGLALAFAGIAALVAVFLPHRYYLRDEVGEFRPKADWRTLWVFVATMSLYVGVENALAGWLPTYAQRLAAGGVLSGRAAEIALCFWVAELVGRALTALVVKRIDERVSYRVCLTVVIAMIVLLVMTPHLGEAWIFSLTAMMALSLSPIFPLAVSFLLARVGNDPRVGRVFASASLGGSLLPWLTGVGSAWFQSLRLGFIVPATGAALILLLSWRLPRDGAVLKVAAPHGLR